MISFSFGGEERGDSCCLEIILMIFWDHDHVRNGFVEICLGYIFPIIGHQDFCWLVATGYCYSWGWGQTF